MNNTNFSNITCTLENSTVSLLPNGIILTILLLCIIVVIGLYYEKLFGIDNYCKLFAWFNFLLFNSSIIMVGDVRYMTFTDKHSFIFLTLIPILIAILITYLVAICLNLSDKHLSYLFNKHNIPNKHIQLLKRVGKNTIILSLQFCILAVLTTSIIQYFIYHKLEFKNPCLHMFYISLVMDIVTVSLSISGILITFLVMYFAWNIRERNIIKLQNIHIR